MPFLISFSLFFNERRRTIKQHHHDDYKTLEELVGRELIVNSSGKYALTELGKQVSHRLRGV